MVKWAYFYWQKIYCFFIDTWAYYKYNRSTKINTKKRTFFKNGVIHHVSSKISECQGQF